MHLNKFLEPHTTQYFDNLLELEREESGDKPEGLSRQLIMFKA